MPKQLRFRRPATLCLVVLGTLLSLSSIKAAVVSFQDLSSIKTHNQTTTRSGVLTEEFSFLLKDFKINHQGENNNLNITIWYRYKSNISNVDYPDFTMVARDIETLLSNYPNDGDYWEIVNKRITLMVLEKYPAIIKITSQLQVSPSPKTGYLRSSITTRDRSIMTNQPRSKRVTTR